MVEGERVPIIMVLIDGLSDYHIKWSDDEPQTTPLEKAQIPVLDALASQNLYGVHDPV